MQAFTFMNFMKEPEQIAGELVYIYFCVNIQL